MSSTDKSKLDGIASGAEVNVNADWTAASGDAQILNKPTSFAPSAHTHAIADVTDLQTTLNGKQASGSYAPSTGISPSAITGTAVVTADSRLSDARTPTAHTHAPSEITGTAVITTDARLSDSRVPTAHSHTTSDVTGLSTSLSKIYWTISMSHTSTSSLSTAPTDSTRYFGNPNANAAVTTSSERAFAFPFSGTIIAAVSTAFVGTTAAVGTANTTGAVSIQNRTTSAFSDLGISGSNQHVYTSLNSPDIKRATGLNITVNATDVYNLRVIIPGYSTTNASGISHHITLFVKE
jgi:hypothetical protein